jgi:hypothetical protein
MPGRLSRASTLARYIIEKYLKSITYMFLLRDFTGRDIRDLFPLDSLKTIGFSVRCELMQCFALGIGLILRHIPRGCVTAEGGDAV